MTRSTEGNGATGVVHVVGCFPPDLGGTEKVAEQLAISLSRRRPVTVVTSVSPESAGPDPQYPPSMSVQRLRGVRVAQIPLMPGLAWRLWRLRRTALFHVHLSQAYIPEVVWLASKLGRRPFVVHFHLDVSPSTFLGPIFVLYKRAVLAPVLRAADAVIALNEEQAEVLRSRYRVRPVRIRVIPNGVPLEPGAATDRNRRAPGSVLRLLFVGRLSPQKNLPRLLEAVRLVEADVRLDIVGDGPERTIVEEMVGRLGLRNVLLLGARRGPELAQCYREADALVLTSDQEGMPLVILEAMAAGLPVVATDVPGVAATLGEAGLLVAPTPRAVAQGIDRLAADACLRADLSARARRRASDFGWDRTVEAVEALYEELAG